VFSRIAILVGFASYSRGILVAAPPPALSDIKHNRVSDG
jgi:hypothetical protein